MPRSDEESKAKEVKVKVERIYLALVRAHRRIYRAVVRGQHDIGSGHPSAQDERETSLGQRLYTDSYRDLVVLGFWYRDLNSPKYVCSEGAMNIIRALRRVAARALTLGNSLRTKDRFGIYHDFLAMAKKIEPDVAEIEPDSGQLMDRHALDMARMRRTLGVAFQATEAEARMASYLMRHSVAQTVHAYCTDSPCGHCCRTYAELAPRLAKAAERRGNAEANPVAHPRGAPSVQGFGWKIGWLFYGQPYEAAAADKTADFPALDAAVRDGSIEGYAQI
ncbi:MAG: hypothetical protein L0Y72_04405 [Gemmataceae bacterium]|nr:hypothetical protein [Gemmataceae bacterium]MCI0738262.1 hypothetical protein [Gemmataceae bacterium]